MTSFEVETFDFTHDGITNAARKDPRILSWPLVYTLDNGREIYVGETIHGVNRMRQHREDERRQNLTTIRMVLDDTFNKSVCWDLESALIRWLSGDGRYRVLNRNNGIVDAEYYMRPHYQEAFEEIFEHLRGKGVFTRSIPEIENSDLFKLSPFKSLNHDQAAAVSEIMTGLIDDLEGSTSTLSVIQGEPGTGKTVVGIYLLKLIRDVAERGTVDDPDPDEMFSEFFDDSTRELFQDMRVGLVVPQQSLRKSIKRVFATVPALREVPVLSAFEVGQSREDFDVLIVDEAHRLTQLAAQAHGTLTKKFKEITTDLFGEMDAEKTQLDWIRAKSRHTVLMLDPEQSVRPQDIPSVDLQAIVNTADRRHPLHTQMRATGGRDYIRYVRRLMNSEAPQSSESFGDYEFVMFERLGDMVQRVRDCDEQFGLSRMVAGYAWEWRSRKDRQAYDIEIDDVRLRWNSTDTDWINSSNSLEEVGSIHTVQGYDLNYAGVIIGPDLRFDPSSEQLVVDRGSYRDAVGKRNNTMRGQITTDQDLLRYIANIYSVLLTRGMSGTYVYVCDPELRRWLAQFIPSVGGPHAPFTDY
ncbi:DUF2075 domain-containing protein [Kocuria sp. JC486]|uniref:DUF2075 domain-containing protein n=1 Tax=Kocuria sp. JC486 TaxID=1970736 RepID=UPI00141D9FDD|nr:DUF2075 domain-containing protein [Kocuria sp. JC486]NHU84813.1 DUF2075 domain-containing protein [Kocuria sp. JC486]